MNKKIRRRYKLKNIMLFSALILFVFVCLVGITSYNSVPKIERILESEDYSYLSNNAKDYIKQNFEETGNILLTEKNKEENQPYLNPAYVEYLNMNEEEKKELAYLPPVTVIDFVPTEKKDEALPPSYDLRTNGFVTPVRNQGGFGLCWAFATAGTMETHVLFKNNTAYNAATTQLFSERQLDYATSSFGIKDYDNEYVSFYSRELGSGGNFYISTVALANGVSMVDYDWKEYDDTDTEAMELHEVLNYDNSLYEINKTYNIPVFNESYYAASVLETARTQHINMVKNAILENGAAVVSTFYTDYCIHNEGGDPNPLLDVTDACYSPNTGHAMMVIGWDDNYEYSYCADNIQHKDSITSCSNVVTGKGVWILKNSWGEGVENEAYPYLAYTSDRSQFHFIVDATKTEDRQWDNNYIVGTLGYTTYSYNNLKSSGIVGEEKLHSIKFMTNALNATYTIKIVDVNGNTRTFEHTVATPGLTTVNLFANDIKVDKDSKVIIGTGVTGQPSFIDHISVFTANVNEAGVVDGSKYDNKIVDGSPTRFLGKTKNIDSNAIVQYKLFDKDGNDKTSLISVSNNIVANNKVNTLISFDNSLGAGKYYLDAIYNSEPHRNTITLLDRTPLSGSGTSSNPYIISNENDLNKIRLDLNAYYKLDSDITLTNDWVPIGTITEPFRGSIDGDGHSIINMNVNDETGDSVGFIGYYLPLSSYRENITGNAVTRSSYIRNLKFMNPQVTGVGNAGVLFGEVLFDTKIDVPPNASTVEMPIFRMENVHFIDGSVTSTDGNAGSLTGFIQINAEAYRKPEFYINNVFNNCYVRGYESSGLIGFVNDPKISGSGIRLILDIKNLQQSGTFEPYEEYSDDAAHSPIVGGVYGNMALTLKNYIINSIFKDTDYYGEFVTDKSLYHLGTYDEEDSPALYATASNGYYISKFNNYTYPERYVSASEIKNTALYNSWDDFESYWEIETVDSIQRIPMLKSVEHDYTDVEDINLKLYNQYDLLDYIEGANDFEYIEVDLLSDGEVVDIYHTINGTDMYYNGYEIDAIGKGETTVHVVNNYDGFEKDVTISVTADTVANPTITYYKDEAGTETYTQDVTGQHDFILEANRFEKSGYQFVEWATIPDGRGTTYVDQDRYIGILSENLRLYAQWDVLKYTLKYDANGGTGTMADWENITGNIQITTNQFTREGYRFIGWNTKPDGTGKSYSDRGTINFDEFAALDGTVLTLYAQWEINSYTVSFNHNGGAGYMGPEIIEYGSMFTVPDSTYTRSGFDFVNWNTAADGSGNGYDPGDQIAIMNDLTLYAQWRSQFTYSIGTYDVDETNKYIDLVDSNTTKENYLKKFTLGPGITVDVEISTKGYVFSGSKTKIYQNGTLLVTYYNIIRGDTNKDGAISALDYVKIKNHIMNDSLITDPVIKKAADANEDNKISSLDYVRIKNIIMGRS